jgi:heme exporter protein CcmD
MMNMGGYASYVWPAYGMMLLFLIFNAWMAMRQYRQTKKKLRAKYASRA